MYKVITETITYNSAGDTYDLNTLVYTPSNDTKLCVWSATFGRMGSLDGVFFIEPRIIQELKGNEVRLGEVLGKHSDINYVIDPDDFTFYDVSEQTIEEMKPALDDLYILSGINPIVYYINYVFDDLADDESIEETKTLMHLGVIYND